MLRSEKYQEKSSCVTNEHVEQYRSYMSDPQLNPTDLLKAKDAAKLIGVHVITLRRYRAAGKLAGFKRAGGTVHYRREDLLALFKDGY